MSKGLCGLFKQHELQYLLNWLSIGFKIKFMCSNFQSARLFSNNVARQQWEWNRWILYLCNSWKWVLYFQWLMSSLQQYYGGMYGVLKQYCLSYLQNRILHQQLQKLYSMFNNNARVPCLHKFHGLLKMSSSLQIRGF